jgi:hypothetical protein
MFPALFQMLPALDADGNPVLDSDGQPVLVPSPAPPPKRIRPPPKRVPVLDSEGNPVRNYLTAPLQTPCCCS